MLAPSVVRNGGGTHARGNSAAVALLPGNSASDSLKPPLSSVQVDNRSTMAPESVQATPHNFTLIFQRPYETLFQKHSPTVHTLTRNASVTAVLLLVALQIIFTAVTIATQTSDQNANIERIVFQSLVFSAITIAALLQRIMHRKYGNIYHRQYVIGGIIAAAAIMWALSITCGPTELSEQSDSSPIIALIIIIHTTSTLVLFPVAVGITITTVIAYIITALIFRPSELVVTTIWQLLEPIIVAIIITIHSYHSERTRRYNYISSIQLNLYKEQKKHLQRERGNLMENIYTMTLERFDIADIADKDTINITSPMEQAMEKLQKVAKSPDITANILNNIMTVISLLGSTSDIFKPQMDIHLTDGKSKDDLTRYIADLVNGDLGGAETVRSENNNNNNAQSPKTLRDSSGRPSNVMDLALATTAATDDLDEEDTDLMDEPSASGSLLVNTTAAAHDRHSRQNTRSFKLNSANQSQTIPNAIILSARSAITNNNNNLDENGNILPQSLLNKDDKTYLEFLKNMDNWDLDVFEIAKYTDNKPLLFIGHALFKRYDLINKFNINKTKLSAFLTAVENKYHSDVNYHNNKHAADVVRTVHFFINRHMSVYMTDLELLAVVIASIVHDMDHPGLNNNFHISTKEEKAILYNDRAVLENHHIAAAFRLLNHSHYSILDSLNSKDYSWLRKSMIDMVLATDLAMHLEFIGQFKAMTSASAAASATNASTGGGGVGSGAGGNGNGAGGLTNSLTASSSSVVDTSNATTRLMLMKMALKCADLGHAAKPLRLHEAWTARITEEFYRQGDEERRRGIPISPFMDRTKANLPQSQIGFLDFLVIPMFAVWMKVIDPDEQRNLGVLENLRTNRDHWKRLHEQSEKEKEQNIAREKEFAAQKDQNVPGAVVH